MVIEESWAFFGEGYAELALHHQTARLRPRTSDMPVSRERPNCFPVEGDLRQFLELNAIVFFEWAGEHLGNASNIPRCAPPVTRLHRNVTSRASL